MTHFMAAAPGPSRHGGRKGGKGPPRDPDVATGVAAEKRVSG